MFPIYIYRVFQKSLQSRYVVAPNRSNLDFLKKNYTKMLRFQKKLDLFVCHLYFFEKCFLKANPYFAQFCLLCTYYVHIESQYVI